MLRIRSMVVAATLALTTGSLGWAVDAPKFSGYLESSYNFNFNRPPSLGQRGRSFDARTNTFLLNAFQLKAEGALGDQSGYVAKALFGTDAKAIKDPNTVTALSDALSTVELQEGYAWYKCPMTNITLTVGKFVTYDGIEVIEGPQNYTVSRGLLFGLAEPFTHTGIKAGYQFIKQLDLSLGVVNGWDSLTDHNRGKTFIGRLGINLGDPFSGGISWTYGAEKDAGAVPAAIQDDARTSLDATFSTKICKQLTVAYQVNYGEEKNANAFVENGAAINTLFATWFGFGIQPRYDVTDKFWIGGRYEYFEDKDGARTAPAQARTNAIQNLTIAPAYKLTDALTFQTELRYDWSNLSYFEQKDAAALNFNSSNQTTIGAKFDYVF